MGIMVYSLLWVMQDFVHQPYGPFPKGGHKALLSGRGLLLYRNCGVEEVAFFWYDGPYTVPIYPAKG